MNFLFEQAANWRQIITTAEEGVNAFELRCGDESNESDVAASLFSRGAADCSTGRQRLLPNSARLLVSDPLPPFGGRPPYKGDIKARRIKDANLPLVRGESRRRRQGVAHKPYFSLGDKPLTPGATICRRSAALIGCDRYAVT